MAVAYIGLGSNLGDRKAYLGWGVERLGRLPGTQLVQTSRWIETVPVGGPPQGMFLNGAAQLETKLEPQQLLHQLQELEQTLGRPTAHSPWGPRVIDLDILSYDDLVLEEPGLILPHPRLHERSFVLIPLSEIAPDWKHPRLGKTAREMLQLLS